jgi:hypothetical protein
MWSFRQVVRETGMRAMSDEVTRKERQTAIRILQSHQAPKDVRGFTVEPGEDHYGDPVLWIWLDVDDANRAQRERVPRIVAFMDAVRDDLFKELHDYRPHVGIRAANA